MNTIDPVDEQHQSIVKRKMGCLIGGAIGDALGATYEFQGAMTVKEEIKKNSKLNNFLPLCGGGDFELRIGQITDDTELALGLTRTLEKHGFNLDEIANTYIRWFNSEPFDCGTTTSKSLVGAYSAKDMIQNSIQFNGQSLSNGSLMRIYPLAVWSIGQNLSDDMVASYVKEEVCLTHPNPIAIDASVVYVLAIRDCILGASKHEVYKRALKRAETVEVLRMIEDALTTPFPVVSSNGKMIRLELETAYGRKFQGYLGVAFQFMFYEFFHTETFYQSLINIISRGGDTDTNSAIAGAFLGAYYGVSRIPKDWIKAVIYCKNPRVARYPEADTRDILQLL